MNNKNRLIYIPIGGAGEIGMNMYLYGYGPEGSERFILVDIGVAFPDMDTTPGVDLIMADVSYIVENKERLDGIFITHAHEDHIGALGFLFSKLPAPIFCRKFTAAIASNKMLANQQEIDKIQVINPLPETVNVGNFTVGFIPLSHSIPEASALSIKTPIGLIIHTGDLKLDRNPVLGEPFEESVFKEVSKEGVLALVCDSTNVFNPHAGRSESTLQGSITDLLKKESGMVVATTFASNIARLVTLAESAQKSGRMVVVLGRAMNTMLATAKAVNVLKNFPDALTPLEASEIPRKKLLVLATGSQGENRAASAQLAREKYMDIELKQGDCFLFSSKTIPGNEKAVSKIVNSLVSRGVHVIDEGNGKYHVSGHANRPDLKTIHSLVNPLLVIPMHGELRHLKEHVTLAEESGFKSVMVPNGSVVEIKKDGSFQISDKIQTGRIYLDGGILIEPNDGTIRSRIQLATKGHISVSILIEENQTLLNGVWVKSKGLPDLNNSLEELESLIEDSIEAELISLKKEDLNDDEYIEISAQRVINKICKKEINRRPVTTFFINRIE